MFWRFFVALAGLTSAATLAAAADLAGVGSGLAMYKARKFAEIRPYDVAQRVETQLVMRRFGQLTLDPLFYETVGEIETDLIPGWPRMVVIDTDNDLRADFFVYHTDEGPSDFYGSFFGLSNGGPPAWVVFPVGGLMDDNSDFLFLFTHWVDQNSDGEIDLIVWEGLDLNGSGWPERGTSAWLADDDFDGHFETAFQCHLRDCWTLSTVNGLFNLNLSLRPGDGSLFRAGDTLRDAPFFNGMFADLRRAARGN